MRTLFLAPDGTLRTDLDDSELPDMLKIPQSLLWIDFSQDPIDKMSSILGSTFHFHPIAIEDALQQSHVPKVDDWQEYLYLVLHPLIYQKELDDPVIIQELDVFLGTNYLVTHHAQSIHTIDVVWEQCQQDERFLHNGVDFLLYKICDLMAASYVPIVEEIDDQIDFVEDEIFNGAKSTILSNIFRLKRSALKLRRVLGPQREVFNRLARDEYMVIDSKSRIYFRDVYDQMVLMHEIIEGIRDLTGGTLETYLSVVNNDMNEIVKTLTVITTIFLPASFLAGFFGMNFFSTYYPQKTWTSPTTFYITLGLMIALPVGIFIWIRKRGWM